MQPGGAAHNRRQVASPTSDLVWPDAGWTPAPRSRRARIEGKFFFRGDEKLYLKGVTYGTFAPGPGGDYPAAGRVEFDFAAMALAGVNTVRTYTVPPEYLLDAAERHGLLVMVGLPWEQHVAFLAEPGRGRSIERRVRDGVRACAEHPAVLAYAIGNEIPAPVARWHGRRPLERFLERLAGAVRAEDQDALVTYVNYPTTEYLELPFLDFTAFNVYLEQRGALEAYLARLQTLAGERPLVLAELGFDSRRNGLEAQAETLDWQLRATFASGCAGAYVFAWTDEWHRGGQPVDDWDFGLTDRRRRPKPALRAAARAFADAPFAAGAEWPRVSVVVCTYNGARTLEETLQGVAALDYPDFEAIVVDDGSTDSTAAIAAAHDVQLISTRNRGLASARNTGLYTATGDIVAYLDDDAVPDRHWLRYLAARFRDSDHAGVGGPNLAASGHPVADCVANAPGGPIHVMLTDELAEHLPGCNMAFRRSVLLAVGGCDPQFRCAGDDVDLCWRIQDAGGTLGFSPAAVVWHRRRESVRAYLKQQAGYGRAEAMLERKWPEKYNAGGHVRWAGRLYGRGLAEPLLPRAWRVYYGTWGSRPFQPLYAPADGRLAALALMPEWYLLVAILAVLSSLAPLWSPLLAAVPALALALGAVAVRAVRAARRADFAATGRTRAEMLRLRCLTGLLHVLQPLSRLYGRLAEGLTPWRPGAAPARRAVPLPREQQVWSESWRGPDDRLRDLEKALLAGGARTARGGDYDRWDVEVRGGALGAARARLLVEEHGAGCQLGRLRSWPRCSRAAFLLLAAPVVIAMLAATAGALMTTAAFGLTALLVAARTVDEAARAAGALRRPLSIGEPGRAVVAPRAAPRAALPAPVAARDEA